MNEKIAVAGATGELGRRMVHALVARGADVRALVRPTSEPHKVEAARNAGASIVVIDDPASTRGALIDVACVVSTLSGLRETIVDAQGALLDAAVAAGVRRFIPSDFAADFTKLAPGENRNLDLRRTFHERLDGAAIRATSILNGMFADILPTPHSPFFDFEADRLTYWGSPEQRLDFTTMDDVAAYTAAVALDDAAPRILRIAGDQISAREMAAAASAATGRTMALFPLGTVDELARRIGEARQADPTSETTVFAPFQLLQYLHNMSTGRAKLACVDNDRYAGLTWTRVKDLLAMRGHDRHRR